MENKELPSEYVSLRQIWLKHIDDCGKAISSESLNEATDERESNVVGAKSICHAVRALRHSLVDYGEAIVRTDIDKWYKSWFVPRMNVIWDETKNKPGEQQVEEKSYQQKWWDSALLNIELYDKIIQVLNKYNMLFQEQPHGYSNVIMESI